MSEPDIKNPVLKLGAAMWAHMNEPFHRVATQNDLNTVELRAQLWAGFMAAAFGSMIRDIGASNAKAIVVTTLGRLADEIAAEQKAKRH